MSQDYVPKEGEDVIETDDIVKVPRVGFEITYLSYFSIFSTSSPEKVCRRKIYLAAQSSDNTLIITNRELAKKCSVGINTVTDTLKLLRNAGLIQTRTGAIMLNPKLASRGSDKKKNICCRNSSSFRNEPE